MKCGFLALAATAVAAPHAAVVMSAHAVGADAPANWAAFVVGPLAAAHAVHTFVCVGPAIHGAQAALWADVGGTVVVAPPPPVDFDDQYTRLAACYGFARVRGAERSRTTRARPDLRWAAPIAPLGTFAADAVSLRARRAPRGTAEHVARGALRSPRGCDYFARQLGAAGRDDARAAMRAAGIPTCAVVDDMFAVVPATLADGYFRLEERFPGPPERRDFDAYAERADDAAVRAHFGAARDADAFVAACRLFGQASWRAVFDRTFHGAYGVGSHDFRHGCCEGA
ncbi:hypothetical protein JL722_9360 [Aureococcus anophagefferens]|nr:hypothetical protein JL722_9360 [Aureococcus anophagefferens]